MVAFSDSGSLVTPGRISISGGWPLLFVGGENLFGAELLRRFFNTGRRDQRLDIFFGDVDGVIVGDVIQSFALGAVGFFERGRVLLSALEL
jgi:hypothetical protein